MYTIHATLRTSSTLEVVHGVVVHRTGRGRRQQHGSKSRRKRHDVSNQGVSVDLDFKQCERSTEVPCGCGSSHSSVLVGERKRSARNDRRQSEDCYDYPNPSFLRCVARRNSAPRKAQKSLEEVRRKDEGETMMTYCTC
jgi:hypothetical protein